MRVLRAERDRYREERNRLAGIVEHFYESTDGHDQCEPNVNPVLDCELCMAREDAAEVLNLTKEANDE